MVSYRLDFLPWSSDFLPGFKHLLSPYHHHDEEIHFTPLIKHLLGPCQTVLALLLLSWILLRLYISLQFKCWERVLPSITCTAAASQHSRARCRARDHLRRHISHIMMHEMRLLQFELDFKTVKTCVKNVLTFI